MAGIEDWYNEESLQDSPLGESPTLGEQPKTDMQSWALGEQDDQQLTQNMNRIVTLDELQQERDAKINSEVFKLKGKTGLPAELIKRNLDLVKQKAGQADFDPKEFRREFPRMAEVMQDRENAELAGDDLEAFKTLERTLTRERFEDMGLFEWFKEAPAQAFGAGQDLEKRNMLAFQQYMGDDSPELEAQLQELESNMGQDFGGGFLLGDMITGSAEILPNILSSIREGVEGGVPGALAGGTTAAVLGQAGPQAALPEELVTVPLATGAGFTAGSITGAANYNYRQLAGESFREFANFRDENGEKLDPGVARIAATVTGAASAGLELFGLSAIVKSFPGGKKALEGVTKKSVKAALKNPSVRKAMTDMAGRFAGVWTVETMTEVMQEGVMMLGGEIAKQVDPGQFEGLTAEEVETRLTETFKQAATGMALISAPGPMSRFVGDYGRVRQAQNTADVMASLGEGATASKTRERLPTKFRDIVAKIREGGPIENVQVPVEKWDELFQGAGVDPQEMSNQVTGSYKAYTEAKATGGDLVIPVEAYAEHLAATEYHAGLSDNTRFRPEDMTPAEARNWQENEGADLRRMIEELEATPDDTSQGVFDDVSGQLQAAGRDRTAAEREARLTQAVFKNLGERTGTDPMELYRQYNISIGRPMPEVLQTPGGDFDPNIDPILDRLRAGDIPSQQDAFGRSLLEVLRETGINDEGGELSARDVDADLPAFTKRLIREDGIGLDRAAGLAVESGYLPGKTESDVLPDDVLALIDQELRGDPVFPVEGGNQATREAREAMLELSDFLEQMGVDLEQMDNAAVRQLLEGRQPEPARQEGEAATTLDQNVLDASQRFAEQKLENETNELSRKARYVYRQQLGDRIAQYDESQPGGASLLETWFNYQDQVSDEIAAQQAEDMDLTESELAEQYLADIQAAADQDPQPVNASTVVDFYGQMTGELDAFLEAASNLGDEVAFQARKARNSLKADEPTSTMNQTGVDNGATAADNSGITVEESFDAEEFNRLLERARRLNQPGQSPQNQVADRTVGGREADQSWRDSTSLRGADGQPAQLYRGARRSLSPADFESDALGQASDNPSAPLGVWFSSDPDDASRYGQTENFFADVRNPRVYTTNEVPAFDDPQEAMALREQLQSEGFDGVVFDYSDQDGPIHVVAFQPDQVIEPQQSLDQSAFHGTPHRFDRFSLDAVGTGEGAQAFGWGLYFAGNREIAEYYRDALSENVLLDGQPMLEGNKLGSATTGDPNVDDLIIAERGDLDEAIRDQSEYLDDLRSRGGRDNAIAIAERELAMLEKLREEGRITKAGEGNLMEVDIPDDADLLDYDAPLNDQGRITEAVRKVTDEVHGEGTFDAYAEANEGGDFRDWKDNLMESMEEREISLALNREGVPGLRYKDGSSRKSDWQISPPDEVAAGDWMVKDANQPNSQGLHFDTEAEAREALEEKSQVSLNYVIWDEDVVTVQAVNDELRQAEEQETSLNQFAGESAQGADQQALATAQERLANGEYVEAVRQDTGWFQGKDGKWRFEIDDSDARYLPAVEGTVGELWTESLERVLDHPALFAAYPGLRNIDVLSAQGVDGRGMYLDGSKEIVIDSSLSAVEQFSTLMHELQHAIQSEEGFAKGGNTRSVATVLRNELLNRAASRGDAQLISQHESALKNFGAYSQAKQIVDFRNITQPKQLFNSMQWYENRDAIRDVFGIPPKRGQARRQYAEQAGAWIANRMERSASNLVKQILADNSLDFASDPAARNQDNRKTLNNAFRKAQRRFDKVDRERLREAVATKEEAKQLGSVSQSEARDLYQRLYGEVEARNTQARQGLGAAERRATPPQATQDIADSDVIVMFRGREMASAPRPANSLQQSRSGKGPRGRITFPQSRRFFKIELLERADLSTYLHESGHLYLEILRDLASQDDSPQQIRDDFQSILNWLGVESAEQIGTEQHEQWARGFEAYVMEGKAPSAELRTVFARFRSWLLAIYKTVQNLNVELTDEVRGVMDRLVATDQEIAQAQEEAGYTPLFTDADAAGMTPEEYANYQAATEQAKQEGQEAVTTQVMREMNREREAWWKERRAEVREEVAAEVNQRPEYVAAAVLGRGKLPNGDPLPEGMEPFKLSKQMLVDMGYGESLKRLPRPFVYAREGGIHPDQAAEVFGYTSGDQMLQALINARPRNKLIEAETERRMKDEFGAMMEDGGLATAAEKAVHNDRRAEVMQTELKQLGARSNRRTPAKKLLQEAAERIIREKTVRQVRPHLYLKAERKASQEAFDAVAKGDFEAATQAKQRQMLNHFLYREATRAQEDVDKTVNYLNKFTKKPARIRMGKAGGDFLEQIDAIMARYEFRKGVSLRQIDKRRSLQKWVEEQNELGFTVDVPDEVLNDSRVVSYKEVTVEELRGIGDAVRQIEHMARLKNKLLTAQDGRNFDEVVDLIVATIEASRTRNPIPPRYTESMKDRIRDFGADAHAWHMKPEFIFRWLDGDEEVGPVWNALFKPIADAELAEQRMNEAASEAMAAIMEPYTRKERAQWYTTKHFIRSTGESMNKASIIAAGLNWGNQYNREILMESHGWNEAQMAEILGHLDRRDWDLIQGIWDHIDSYWPDIEKMEKDLNGVAPEKVQALPVENEHGTFRGGYYPIKYDTRVSTKTERREEKAGANLFENSFSKPATRNGHTKERQGSGGQVVRLDLNVISEHVGSVIHDLTHRRAIVDVNRLTEDKRVADAIKETAGREIYNQIRPWLQATANEVLQPQSFWEKIIGRARVGATVVNMGLKVTTAIVQPLGYLNSIDMIGAKYAWRGLADFFGNRNNGDFYSPWRNMKRATAFVQERSTMMQNRQKTFDRDVRDSLKRLTKEGPIADAQRSFFIMTGLMDMAVSVPTWLGAYKKAMEGKLDGVEAGDEGRAIDYADSIVRQTQSAGGVKDLARIQRGGEVQRSFVMFYSYFNVLYNQVARQGGRAIAGQASVPQLAASAFLLWFAPSILGELIAGRGPEDEEEWAKWAATQGILYPMGTVVGVRDVANAALTPFGYGASPAFDAFGYTARAGSIPYKALSSEEEVTRADVKSAVLAAGYWGKLPSRQAWITGEYIYDLATGQDTPENPQEFVRDLFFSRPVTER